MAINYSKGNDLIVPSSSDIYRGLEGDDIYILSKGLSSKVTINIVDTKGENTIQFVEGFGIEKTKFANNAFQITLDNNSVIIINSAENYTYEVGGNSTTGEKGKLISFKDLSKAFGIEQLPDNGTISGDSNFIVTNQEFLSSSKNFEWLIKKPEDVGFYSQEVDQLMDYLKTPFFNTQAAILIKGNTIIAEYYTDGYNNKDLATSWSVAKSFASTVIGIAIDEGFINSVNDPITKYLPEWQGKEQDNITLENLLGMRSGMEDHAGLGVYFQADMTSFSLERGVIRGPGESFSYSNEDSMLFGRIIENATGMSFQEYADSRLFDKLNIDETWWTDKAGNTLTYAGLDMTPREFAKFGLMIAQEGLWEGQQIVSESWISKATVELDNLASYGYQWWTSTISGSGLGLIRTEEYPFFSALGLDGQYIYVWPEEDIVLVRFTKYTHLGNKESSVVDIGASTYHGTESGSVIVSQLEELLYAVGNNPEDQLVPSYSEFG
ncbi:MAG: serine hydrolase [Pseudomonadota bacterium]|nr:serine hydrolase [Pseudomonadota bacterium]